MVQVRFPRTISDAMVLILTVVVTLVGGQGCTRKGKTPVVDAAPQQVNLPSTSHPGAGEVEYRYLDKVWETDVEREIVEYLSRAHTAEKAYRMVRKDPAAYMNLLHQAVRARKFEVRVQAVIILGLLKDANPPETTRILIDALLYDEKPNVRAVAAKSFVTLKKPDAVQPLIRSLNEDPFEGVRANAAWALGEIGDASAIPHLRKATADDDAFVRLRAVGALMDLRARNGIPELITRLGDSNVMVAERAHQALRHITGTDKGRDPMEWRRVFGKPVDDQVGTDENVVKSTPDTPGSKVSGSME